MKLSILLMTTLLGFNGFAASLEGVNFSDSTTVGSNNLVLNGVGLRKVSKFGISVKVYVAGLYTKAKSSDAKALIDSTDYKRLELVFLRTVDKAALVEAWQMGHFKNCKTDCETSKQGLAEFNKLMQDMRDKNRMVFDISPDAVDVNIEGREKKSAKITNKAFAKSLLAIFIGDTPPTEDLKKGLLGL